MPRHFLSCDWGTTNFRLRLVSLDDLRVLEELSSDKGVGELAKAWRARNEDDERERISFYTGVLREQVAQLKKQAGDGLDGVPVVISGMASSTIGLIELPYATLPVPTDGSGFRTKSIERTADFPHELLLISGLRSDDDVMRGEETQLIGCLTREMEHYQGRQFVIHPGTHSKHITIDGGRLTGFRTYMSGEFFKLLSTHGILRDNVAANPLTDAVLTSFEQGVQDAIDASLLHAAFRVRTNDLLGRLSKEDNYHYLSGLLIGQELQVLRSQEEQQSYLCCGPGLFRQYSAALRVLKLDERVTVFPPEWEEGAVVRGQAKVLRFVQES